jgi:hypothetical protein
VKREREKRRIDVNKWSGLVRVNLLIKLSSQPDSFLLVKVPSFEGKECGNVWFLDIEGEVIPPLFQNLCVLILRFVKLLNCKCYLVKYCGFWWNHVPKISVIFENRTNVPLNII